MSSNVSYAKQAPGATGVDPNHPAELGYKVVVVDGERGVTRPDPAPRKKFAIVGFAASTRDQAPFDDPTYEIWGLNQLYRHIPRASRWFDIHANWREDNVPGTDHPGYLAQIGIPVYMSSYESSVPTCVNYPLQEVIDHVAGVDYFTSTVAFMVALAIREIDVQVRAEIEQLEKDANLAADEGNVLSDEEIKRRGDAVELLLHPTRFRQWTADRYGEREIAVFGIDLVVGTEYDWQKSCVEFLLGLAQARNITLRLPNACALLKQRWRYGYQTEPDSFPIRHAEVVRRGTALDKEREQLLARMYMIDGARQENTYWSQIAELRTKGATVKLNEDT